MTTRIVYATQSNIDKKRWDDCINNATNSRVYALSTYLDEMCHDWHALIAGDYEMVMPLPIKSKFGIHYLYQPAFCQQLGIFSTQEITQEDVQAFLQAIPTKFKYWDISLNAENKVMGYNQRLGKNYLLNLHFLYEILQQSYKRNTKRNIKKAIDANVEITESNDFGTTVLLHRKRFNDGIGADERDYKNLEKLLAKLSGQNKVKTFIATKNGNVIASSTYLLHNNRIIFLINGNLAESLETGATHLLKDHVIKTFAGSDLVMDFEGSDFVQFANFYEQFGAKQIEYYPIIINNNLPWPIKYLKRSAPVL